MRDAKKDIVEAYLQAAAMHTRMREVARQIPHFVPLPDFPPEPQSQGELRMVMDILRKDINDVTEALHTWDRRRNGCETRTREMIEADIERDLLVLKNGQPDPYGRSLETIRGNIDYDRMQLGRS